MTDTQGLPGGWTSMVPSYSYNPEDDPGTFSIAASFQPARPAANSMLGTSAPPQHQDPTARSSELTATPTYLNPWMQWHTAPLGTALSPGAVPYLVDPWGTHTHPSLHTLASGPSGQSINTIPAVVETRRRVRDQISFPTQTGASGSGSSNIFKEAMPEPPTSRILTSSGAPVQVFLCIFRRLLIKETNETRSKLTGFLFLMRLAAKAVT
ncbi:uncharacterized protein BO72DRAFT_491564 [Aspergillus fijiensis CBS 313.89]|uniref:Uncharacterized protein n=1 Tax=Aspergillus fijiensis CBS 313.89 TaxID=1448319 RepID=A0A8G1S3Q6_9EURO|nr:uncharacterized protein BO72DRAFT_491564 [Aspergillus fijiensis CBS 313.89]RAK81936.1 hypothetical protein BO72DRAFT_491564 [Aspergillus fijiensis CBS 313.89]